MAERKPLSDVFHFDNEGTLTPPGPIGRIIRLLLGLVIMKFVYDWLVWVDSSDYGNGFVLFWIVFSVALVPYVVNIGFGINSGAKPRYALIGIWALAAALGFVVEGKPDSEVLWSVIEITQIYIYGHLGISFLLSAVLSTPGCEMRAIPHLLGKVSGKGSQEHYCPGFIDNVDRWERDRSSGNRPDA